MAEILGLTASLVTITSLGTKLIRTLYDFATTISSAREEIDYISANVSDYADILELLVEQLEHDLPIHSKKAIRLAERLYDRSYQLFDRIWALIPDKQRTRDHISFLARISWTSKDQSSSSSWRAGMPEAYYEAVSASALHGKAISRI